MHLHSDIATYYIQMNIYWGSLETCKNVPVLLVDVKVIWHKVSFQQFDFSVFGDCI